MSMNPGTVSARNWKYPCRVCAKPVTKNQDGLQCDNCELWTHLNCVPAAINITKLVDVMIIGETKIDESYTDAVFNVEDYRLYINDQNAAGGGVMVYVRSDIPSRRLSQTEPENVQAIHIELQIGKCKWLMIANYNRKHRGRKLRWNIQPKLWI